MGASTILPVATAACITGFCDPNFFARGVFIPEEHEIEWKMADSVAF
jgi:hypothetical protein